MLIPSILPNVDVIIKIIKNIKFLNSNSWRIRLKIKIIKVINRPIRRPLIQPFFVTLLPAVKPPRPTDKSGIIILHIVRTGWFNKLK